MLKSTGWTTNGGLLCTRSLALIGMKTAAAEAFKTDFYIIKGLKPNRIDQ